MQETLVHPVCDTWLNLPAYCLSKVIWKRMQHFSLQCLTGTFSHSPLLHRVFVLPVISVLSFQIKANKMENVFALCSQRNKQGTLKKNHYGLQTEKVIYCGIQRQGQKSWLFSWSPVFNWNSWDINITQLQVVFSKDFETKAGSLHLPFFTVITVIKVTLAFFLMHLLSIPLPTWKALVHDTPKIKTKSQPLSSLSEKEKFGLKSISALLRALIMIFTVLL